MSEREKLQTAITSKYPNENVWFVVQKIPALRWEWYRFWWKYRLWLYNPKTGADAICAIVGRKARERYERVEFGGVAQRGRCFSFLASVLFYKSVL